MKSEVDAENDGLSINDKLRVPVLQRGLDDPWITAAPVVAVPSDQAHAIAVALQAEAATIVSGEEYGFAYSTTQSASISTSHGRSIFDFFDSIHLMRKFADVLD